MNIAGLRCRDIPINTLIAVWASVSTIECQSTVLWILRLFSKTWITRWLMPLQIILGPVMQSLQLKIHFFVPVSSHGTLQYLHSATMMNESKHTEGGNSPSQSIFPITTNTPFILNFRTDHIHEGEDVEIMIASWLRVNSTSFRMKIDMIASLLWKVEKIYLKVVWIISGVILCCLRWTRRNKFS